MALDGEQNIPEVITSSVTGDVSRAVLSVSQPVIPAGFQTALEQVQAVDVKLEDLAPDAPELVQRGKNNVDTGTTNITDQLDLLEDDKN